MSKPRSTPGREPIDYARMEPDWIAGVKSAPQIVDEHYKATGQRVTRQALVKHFESRGVARSLGARIQAASEAKVAEQVAAKVAAATAGNSSAARTKRAAADALVETNAEAVAAVRLSHRQDIARLRDIAAKLTVELEQQTDQQGLFQELADLVIGEPDEDASDAAKQRKRRLREAFERALGLGGRVDIVRKLAETMRLIVEREREAFGMKPGSEGGAGGLPLVEIRDYTGKPRLPAGLAEPEATD